MSGGSGNQQCGREKRGAGSSRNREPGLRGHQGEAWRSFRCSPKSLSVFVTVGGAAALDIRMNGQRPRRSSDA